VSDRRLLGKTAGIGLDTYRQDALFRRGKDRGRICRKKKRLAGGVSRAFHSPSSQGAQFAFAVVKPLLRSRQKTADSAGEGKKFKGRGEREGRQGK